MALMSVATSDRISSAQVDDERIGELQVRSNLKTSRCEDTDAQGIVAVCSRSSLPVVGKCAGVNKGGPGGAQEEDDKDPEEA